MKLLEGFRGSCVSEIDENISRESAEAGHIKSALGPIWLVRSLFRPRFGNWHLEDDIESHPSFISSVMQLYISSLIRT